MRAYLFAFTCLACARQSLSKPNSRTLASLLLAPNPAARLASRPTVARFAKRAPAMQEDATVAETQEVPTEPPKPKFDVREMAGVSAPLGFFDPAGFTEDASEGKIRFYREVELKHGRVAMLAALGFLVAEQFHPLFGGNIDVPSLVAFQQTPLQGFFFKCVLAIGIPEVLSVFTFQTPWEGETWAIKTDHEPGNLGFDPLNLKPNNAKDLKTMQTKELNNGRLAMIAFAGMVYQEALRGGKLF